ncbi:MAG: hypothetical protein KGQ88_11645 [Chloroflexi bacterium]|nr:hypothetical protein [Chloroflexota bacterium]
MLTDLAALREILLRRDPDLVPALERVDDAPLAAAERERMRRAVVDELCEAPDASGRRALHLSELLRRLGDA